LNEYHYKVKTRDLSRGFHFGKVSCSDLGGLGRQNLKLSFYPSLLIAIKLELLRTRRIRLFN